MLDKFKAQSGDAMQVPIPSSAIYGQEAEGRNGAVEKGIGGRLERDTGRAGAAAARWWFP